MDGTRHHHQAALLQVYRRGFCYPESTYLVKTVIIIQYLQKSPVLQKAFIPAPVTMARAAHSSFQHHHLTMSNTPYIVSLADT